jgi:hypothetical protein
MNNTFSVTEGIKIDSRNDRGEGKVASSNDCYSLKMKIVCPMRFKSGMTFTAEEAHLQNKW